MTAPAPEREKDQAMTDAPRDEEKPLTDEELRALKESATLLCGSFPSAQTANRVLRLIAEIERYRAPSATQPAPPSSRPLELVKEWDLLKNDTNPDLRWWVDKLAAHGDRMAAAIIERPNEVIIEGRRYHVADLPMTVAVQAKTIEGLERDKGCLEALENSTRINWREAESTVTSLRAEVERLTTNEGILEGRIAALRAYIVPIENQAKDAEATLEIAGKALEKARDTFKSWTGPLRESADYMESQGVFPGIVHELRLAADFQRTAIDEITAALPSPLITKSTAQEGKTK